MLALPPRYEGIEQLGKGGGGEVWRVRDRLSGQTYALKALAEGSTEDESLALVREATALGALEGLGVPRVLRFGRLPSGALYLVRELVDGVSLDELMQRPGEDLRRALDVLVRAAEQLTVVHRAGLLHGDVKPANIMRADSGEVTLVDLGLATAWREGGAQVEGLTPRYAAPELLLGRPLTVRAEVYALGVILADLLEVMQPLQYPPLPIGALRPIMERSTADEPAERHPSADEFASAVRGALGDRLADSGHNAAAYWPIVGMEPAVKPAASATRSGAVGVLATTGTLKSAKFAALLDRFAHDVRVVTQPCPGLVECVESGALQSEETRALLQGYVAPLLAKYCTKCHGGDKSRGGLRLDGREGRRAVADVVALIEAAPGRRRVRPLLVGGVRAVGNCREHEREPGRSDCLESIRHRRLSSPSGDDRTGRHLLNSVTRADRGAHYSTPEPGTDNRAEKQ